MSQYGGEFKPWKMGKERPGRNPILAEKTPRRRFIGWEFAPPAAPAERPRWHEPDQPLSILDMLASQKPKIEKEKRWKQESEQRIKNFEETLKREAALRLTQSTKSFDEELSYQNSFNGANDSLGAGASLHTDRSGLEGGGSGRGHSQGLSSSQRRRVEKELLDIPVSQIRSLQKTHPIILANYRAQRAQHFLEHMADTDPRAPLPVTEEHRTSFRPAGVLVRYQNSSELEHSKKKSKSGHKITASRHPPALAPIPRSEADLVAELQSLTAALEQTNDEIERQTLKMALKKKVKTYDKRSA